MQFLLKMLFLQSLYSKTRYVSDITRKKDGGCTFCHNTLRNRQRKSHTVLRQYVSLWYWTNFVYARLFEVYRVTWSVLISAFWQLTFVFFPLWLCLNIPIAIILSCRTLVLQDGANSVLFDNKHSLTTNTHLIHVIPRKKSFRWALRK